MSGLASAVLLISQHSLALTALDDQELSKVEGQALLSMEITQGTNQVDEIGQAINQSGVKFYRLGLEAEMELNANIRKLQLGCGGVNNSIHGKPGCDIDIDHISLSGLVGENYTSDQRAASSAIISNPFVEFAIGNAASASTRRVLGFRLSAEKIQGLLTMGTENTATPNGINSFSGYMRTKEASGTAQTAVRQMTYAATGQYIEGTVRGGIGSVELPLDLHYKSNDYTFDLTSAAAPFVIPSTPVYGTRIKDNIAILKGVGTVETINFQGPLAAQLLDGALTLNKQITGSLTGLRTDITVNQNLGLIHALYLNNPASLSLQSDLILWPGASMAANPGWWLALEGEVDLGRVDPIDLVNITDDVLRQTIPGINHDLTTNVRDCGGILSGCVIGGSLDVGEIKNPAVINFPLNNLTLQGQNFKSNCFGGHKFC